MKVLVLHGSLENRPESAEMRVISHLVQAVQQKGLTAVRLELSEAQIPLFNPTSPAVPEAVISMCQTLKAADVHIWFTPLYHGSMTGALKNALDWVELTSADPSPYLTGKIVALTCLSDGLHALQGINAMDAVAKSLRAWVLPFSVPVIKPSLFETDGTTITDYYKSKFDQLISMLAASGKLLQA
ncbi:NADPH-dependent FMN reductase [Cesiribacter sp. SM1]|uniref:NADPH-dependent FMN reductase n=1 Tax=Cesiribacter sp. SM1 TaxID=2861196 RepID=UPI001CD57F75|nr:NADPH-dependent FMN reductase [Cesiribacter sp. SM1]